MNENIKKLKNKIKDCSRMLVQTFFLILAFVIMLLLYEKVFALLKNIGLTYENMVRYILIRLGKLLFAIIVTFLVLLRIRTSNEKIIVNKGNFYHNHHYFWYVYCSVVLGYKKCNLKLVPIYTQYKLVINSVFESYYVGDDEDYRIIEDEEISVSNSKNKTSEEVNLVLMDTYPISLSQLPKGKKKFATICVSRKNVDGVRSYSPKFVDKVMNIVRSLPSNTKINVYATTNPKHTELLAKNVFQLADRGNISSLVVYQQSNKDNRNFEFGYKIY